MGFLTIDHRQGQGIDSKKGKLEEYVTVRCRHCPCIIAILTVFHDKYELANIDIGRASPLAHHLSQNYVGKRRCQRCNASICRRCAAEMELNGDCPGPWEARVELAAKNGIAPEFQRHQYGQIVGSGR